MITEEQRAEARAAVDAALTRYKTLCQAGFGISNGKPSAPIEDKLAQLAKYRASLFEHLDEVATAIAFLRICKRTRVALCGSYGLKHAAESWGRANGMAPYVANGSAIVAALYLGIRVSPYGGERMADLGKANPNASVAVSRKHVWTLKQEADCIVDERRRPA